MYVLRVKDADHVTVERIPRDVYVAYSFSKED